MRLRALCCVGSIALGVLSAPLALDAQRPKVPRIGFLSGGSPTPTSPARYEVFRQGLGKLGYVEGKNIVIEYRWAEGKLDRFPALAAELVRLKVDVIVTWGPTATLSAKEATNTIPIVFAFDSDPIGNGFVASLARPGGNITGLSTLAPELSGKQLELLKEIVPRLSRVAVLGTSTRPGTAQQLRETELAAGAFGVKLQSLDILSPKHFETAFQAAVKERAEAVLVRVSGPILFPHRTEVAALAVKSRLPVMYERAEEVEAGGLVSYGVNVPDLYRRGAIYVDKILKGAKPADLPVEQSTILELIINRRTVQTLGLTIPPELLVLATEVIE